MTNQNLQDYLDEQEQVEKEAFTITDDRAANWALRKIGQMQKQIEDNNALAVAEIDKIEAWNKQENQKSKDGIDYFQGLLSYYALSKREADPKFKSLKLPNGKIAFRKQQPKWSLDEEKVIQSLKDANASDLIKVTEKPKLADIKKAFQVKDGKAIDMETGEVVEGITIEDQPDTFGVKTDA